MKQIMASLRQNADSFENARMKNAERTDYLNDETGLPKSDVISFRFQDGDQLIVRPSGTEPKLKAYLFTRAGSAAEAENRLDSLQEIVDGLCR